jgi:hypothetical protein
MKGVGIAFRESYRFYTVFGSCFHGAKKMPRPGEMAFRSNKSKGGPGDEARGFYRFILEEAI